MIFRFRRQLSLWLALSMLSIVLSGCWDQLEIEDRALVLGLAIDQAPEDSQPKSDQVTHIKDNLNLPMIRVTAQIAVPGRVPLGPSNGESGGSGGSQNPVWVVQVYGYTLDDAMNNLQQQISDPRYLIHLRVLIISEEIARTNLGDLNDYLRRNPEVRRRTWMLVSEGEASQFMDVNPPLQRVPTLYILSMMEKAVESGKFPADYIGVFWSSESKWGENGFLPYISRRNKENILIKGLAYFSGGKMVGATVPIEIGAFMAMKGMDPGGYSILFKSVTYGPVMIMVNKRFSRIKVHIVDGKPQITYHIALDTGLDEHVNNNVSVNSTQKLEDLEGEFRKGALKIFQSVIDQTRQKQSDIFGLGEHVRAHAPAFWNSRIHSKSDWEQLYSSLTIHLDVDVAIRRVGLKER
ncbi:Ger(x)C family spore germination protein [Paenibacillus albidus]|uniref:Ger(x)C family spore germination protein n=1 Tax=Paenibacillus albidus TaxID=2041023 RepID=UPI001BEB6A2A|nr:Ger(x)C family spore germination protein [Paenibacillus albidus]MBT2289815.1 Ger(x)C family spore germination protein [Paenibacillus albidus]